MASKEASTSKHSSSATKNKLREIDFVEQQLLDPNVRYHDKIPTLANAWRLLKEQQKGESKSQEHANFLLRISIRLVLMPEWKSLAAANKTHLKRQIAECGCRFKIKNGPLASKCNSILDLIDEPWGDKTLTSILQNTSTEDSDVLRFLESDRHILRTRLCMMCEDKSCYDLAQRLSSLVWTFYKRDRQQLSFLAEDDLNYVLDLHLVLFIRQNKRTYSQDIIAQMRDLSFHIGLLFIKRFKEYRQHPPDDSKLWKKSDKAAQVVVQLFATRATKVPMEELGSMLNSLMVEWCEMFCGENDFGDLLRSLGGHAVSVDHLIALANSLDKKLPPEYHVICIELLIKSLTSEVNQMQHIRTLRNDTELRVAEEHLSAGFLKLAKLLSNNLNECRECVLTAFSLNPTAECLERIKEMAVQSVECKREVLDTGQDENIVQNGEINHISMETRKEERSSEATSELQLPQNLRDDLHVILNCPRNRDLNWQLSWPDLIRRCNEYHEEMMKGERPAVKELQYLEIDYSKYKHLPANEDENHDGIEKGYELDNDTGTDVDMEDGCAPEIFSSQSETGSDASVSKSKKKLPESIDPRRKKKVQKTPKRSYPSSDDCRSKINFNDSLLSKKVKSQRKPKGKTPKSDAKRNGKSSVVQFQVTNSPGGQARPQIQQGQQGQMSQAQLAHNVANYHNVSPEDLQLLERKLLEDRKKPRDTTKSLRTFRPPKKSSHGRSAFGSFGDVLLPSIALEKNHSLELYSERRAAGYREPYRVPGLDTYDMMEPLPTPTTVLQVAQMPGNTPAPNVSSTVTKPEDASGTQGAASSTPGARPAGAQAPPGPGPGPAAEVNGKPTQSGGVATTSAGNSVQSVQLQSGPAPTLYPTARGAVQLLQSHAAGAAGSAPVQLAPLGALAPGLSPLSQSRVVVRRSSQPHPGGGAAGAPSTALPQFSQTFGIGRDATTTTVVSAPASTTSALKQALLADKQPKLNATQTAAGFGSQTQPAGFGAPAHPPGFGIQQQQPPVPPLQTRTSTTTTTLTGSSLPQQPEPPPLQQEPGPPPPQTRGLLVAGPQQAQVRPPGTAAAPAAAAATTQVIVRTSSGAVTTLSPATSTPSLSTTSTSLTPLSTALSTALATATASSTPPRLMLTVGTTSTSLQSMTPPRLTTTRSSLPLPATLAVSTGPTGLQVAPTLARSVVTVANTKVAMQQAQQAQQAQQLRLPAAVFLAGQAGQPRQQVPGLVQRTLSYPPARGLLGQAVKVVVSASAPVPVPALVHTGSGLVSPAAVATAVTQALSVVSSPAGVTALVAGKRVVAARPVPGNMSVLSKFRRNYDAAQLAAASTAAETATATAATSTTPPGAAAAAAEVAAAAKAEAANAPANVQRRLYPVAATSALAPQENPTLSAQLREFDEVMTSVRSSKMRQAKARQSLEEDAPVAVAPGTPASARPDATAQSPTQTSPPAAAQAATLTARPAPAQAQTPAPPLVQPQVQPQAQTPVQTQVAQVQPQVAPQVAAPPVAAATVPAAPAQPQPQPQLQAQPQPQLQAQPQPQLQAQPQILVQAQVQAVQAVQTVQAVQANPVPTLTTVSVAGNFTQTLALTPKKKAKAKTLTMALTTSGTVVPVVPAIVIPATAPTLPPAPAAASTSTTATVTLHHDQRMFKPTTIIQTLSAAKHPINQKMTEDEETTSRIMSILRQYEDQMRCSPEANNKPAPRRRNQVQAGSGSGSGGSGSGSSPTAKRKSKKSRGSGGEMSPGTDDTYTQGSEDSSIASHFADGTMEATPTSPLSTCDDRPVTAAAAAAASVSGETAATVATPSTPTATPVTTSAASTTTTTTVMSFAGVTKAPSLLVAGEDTVAEGAASKVPDNPAKPQPSASLVSASAKTPSPPKVPVPVSPAPPAPKVQTLVHATIRPHLLAKSPVALKLGGVPKVQVVNKMPTTQKPTMIKVQQPLAGPIKIRAQPQHLQTLTLPLPQLQPPPQLQPQPDPKAAAVVKVQQQQLTSEVTIQAASNAAVAVLPSVQDGQAAGIPQGSRVIQSVEKGKLAQSSELDPSPPAQPPSATTPTAPTQVTHLERALQSKQVSQTPLLARALKSPASMPTTFTGILSTTTRPVPKLTDVSSPPKQKAQNPVNQSSAITSNIHVINLRTDDPVKKTPAVAAQPTVTAVPTVLHRGPASQAQQLLESHATNSDTVSSTATTSQTISVQQVTTTPVVMLPSVHQSSPEIQLPSKVQVTSPVLDPCPENEGSPQNVQPSSLAQPENSNMMVLPSGQENSVPSITESSSTMLCTPHIVQLAPQAQALETNLQERQKTVDDVPPSEVVSVCQEQTLSQAQVEITPQNVQLQEATHIVPSVAQAPLASQISQHMSQVQLTPQRLQSSPPAVVQPMLTAHLTSQILPPEAEASLQVEQTSQTVPQILQPITQGQMTSQIIHSAPQILEPVQEQIMVSQEQILHPVTSTQPSAQLLLSSPTSSLVQSVSQIQSLPQMIIPATSQMIQSGSQLIQTTSQVPTPQLIDTSQLQQIVHSSPQAVQSISQTSMPHLVQTSKSPSQQRFSVQPVQLSSATTTSQLRRISGEGTPHLVQISQPSLIQSVQTSIPTQSVSMALTSPVSYTNSRLAESEGNKGTSPTKQNVVPLYVSAASQLPMLISPTGMVQVNMMNSPSVVLRQFSKQDGKLQGDSSHETYVISCDSTNQPIYLTSTIPLFGGNVVTTGHLSTALTTQTTATVVASPAPMYSVASVVDSSIATDTSVLSLNATPASNEAPPNVSISTMATSPTNPVNQMYSPLTSTAQTVLEVPVAAVSQAVPRAAAPMTSAVPSPASTMPSGSPARPSTLLQLCNLNKLRKHQEKEVEMQKIQQSHRLNQQIQQLQPSQVLPVPELQQVTPTQTQSGPQQLVSTSLLLNQLESKKSPPKQPNQLQSHPKTEPTQLKQLLERSPEPLPEPLPPPPLHSTVVRRLSDTMDDPNSVLAFPLKEEEDPQNSAGGIDQRLTETGNLEQNVEECKVKVESLPIVNVDNLSKDSSVSISEEQLSNVHVTDNLVPVSLFEMQLQEMQLPDSSTELGISSADKLPVSYSLEDLQLPVQSPVDPSPVKLERLPTPPIMSLPSISTSLEDSKPGEQQQPCFTEKLPVPPSEDKLHHSLSTDKEHSVQKPTPSTAPEIVTPPLLLSTASPEKQQLLAVSSNSPPKLMASTKGKNSPKIYSVVKAPPFKVSSVKLPQKLTKPTQQVTSTTSTMKAMVLTQSGGETFSPVSDAVVLGQTENQSCSGATPIKGVAPSGILSQVGAESDQTTESAALSITGAKKDAVIKIGEVCYKRITPVSEVQQQQQLPRLNPLSKFSSNQPSPQKIHQLPMLEAPPLAPVSTSKPLELSSSKSAQLDDINPSSRGLQSGLPVHLYSEVKPASSSEVRVYPPSSGSADTEKIISPPKTKSPTSYQLAAPNNVPAPPLVLTSVQVPATTVSSNNCTSPGKVRGPAPITYLALKSPSPKIQTPTQTCLQLQTTSPLQVQKPVSAKAQAVLHQPQALQSPGTSTLKLHAAVSPALTVHQHTISTSESAPESDPSHTVPKPKRQRIRKRVHKHQEKANAPEILEQEATSPGSKLSPVKSIDSECGPSKRSPRKRESTAYKQISPEIVSQHLSDTIMRVSIGADDPSSTSDENAKPPEVKDVEDIHTENFDAPLVKDVFYEGQEEKIPVEVAVAALCGEDIEIAQDLIEGNLQGDPKRRGSITLLPADPSDNTEELNFNFKNVVQMTPDDNLKSELQEPVGTGASELTVSSDSSAIASITTTTIEIESSEVADTAPRTIKKELGLISENKDDDSLSSKIVLKRKATSQTGSFSEHSRSLSGSEDLSMDKTSTSDIFPESDILFETTLSPSFLGEIAQLSPTNSQDAVCASPEPVDKKKRCFSGKSSLSNKTPESYSETMPKLDQEDSKDMHINKSETMSQFNGGTTRTNLSMGDSFSHDVLKQDCTFLETSFDSSVSHILSANDEQNSLASSSNAMSSFFANTAGAVPGMDDAPWEKEPLYVSQSSDNEDDEFWKKTLTAGVSTDINQEGDTNSSSTPSDILPKNVRPSGRSARRSGVKRKDDSANSPSRKQSAEKRKKVTSISPNEEDKFVPVLRSSASKVSNQIRRDGSRSRIMKEDAHTVVQRRVSRRTHKPVTKFDELQKGKPSSKQPPKVVAHKKK